MAGAGVMAGARARTWAGIVPDIQQNFIVSNQI